MTEYEDISAELISVAVGSHHGLFDCFNNNGVCTYIHRMDLQAEYDNRAINGYLMQCTSETELLELFKKANAELVMVFEKLQEIQPKDNEEMLFYLGQLERLMQSALIDADRLDTASFMQGSFVKNNVEHMDIWSECIENIESYLKSINKESDISDAREFFSKSPQTIFIALMDEAVSNTSGI